jgi:hypothetical protein
MPTFDDIKNDTKNNGILRYLEALSPIMDNLSSKLIIDYTTPQTVWTIDHNLGSRPLVQVFSAMPPSTTPVSYQLELSSALPDVEQVLVARISSATLNGLTVGVKTAVRWDWQFPYGVTLLMSFVHIVEPVTANSYDIDFNISTVPMTSGPTVTGGTITVDSSFVLGMPVYSTAPITANNVYPFTFPPGFINITVTPVGGAVVGGAVDVYLAVQPSAPYPNRYAVEHPTDSRVIITHAFPRVGRAVLIG